MKIADTIHRWTKIGQSCEPTDEGEIRPAIDELYKIAGMRPPRLVVCNSPLGSVIMGSTQMAGGTQSDIFSLIRKQNLGNRSFGVTGIFSVLAESMIRERFMRTPILPCKNFTQFALRDTIGRSVYYGSIKRLIDNANDYTTPMNGDSLYMMADAWREIELQMPRGIYGYHDALWLAGYEYTKNEGMALDSAVGDILVHLAKHCGWWIPYTDMFIVSKRHKYVLHDEQNRIHCDDDYAIRYADGWGVYVYHNVFVPERKKWILLQPEKITANEIDRESNIEIRRIMIEKMGYESYIREAGLQPVHSDECGVLYRKPFWGDEALVVVAVDDATPEPDGSYKKYVLRVPPNVQTAREAVAWTFGLNTEQYQPIKET